MKDKIFNCLSDLDISVAYGVSDDTIFPKLMVNLVSHYNRRFSNKKGSRHICYQLVLHDNVPRDVENDALLNQILDKLESANIRTTEFIEVINATEDLDGFEWAYLVEAYE